MMTYSRKNNNKKKFMSVWFHFSEIVWIDKLHDLTNDFVSLKMVAMEIGKKISSYHSNGCQEKKNIQQEHEPYRYKLKILSWLEKY